MHLFSILRAGECISHQVRAEPPYHLLLLTYKVTFSTTVYKDSLFPPCACSVRPYVVPILSGMKGYLIAALRRLSSWMPSIFSFINCQTVFFIASFKKWSFKFTACFKTLSAPLVILLCVHAWCVCMCVGMNTSQYICGRKRETLRSLLLYSGIWGSNSNWQACTARTPVHWGILLALLLLLKHDDWLCFCCCLLLSWFVFVYCRY